MSRCQICLKDVFFVQGEICSVCIPVMRAWVARGIKDAEVYLAKYAAFEEYEANRVGHDPSPAGK